MTYKQVVDFLKDEIEEVQGVLPDDFILTLDDVEHLTAHSLDWSIKDNILRVSGSQFQVKEGGFNVILKVRDAKRAIAMVGNHFLVKHSVGIHPTAIIEEGARIGSNCYIGAHVIIHSCVEIGSNVRIKAGAVIGNEGFGFVRDGNGDLVRFPQLGRVIICDGVEIGSNTTIDRGALSDTIIGRNTKINNQVHIAHNVRIGKNTAITAKVNISGSSQIGDNVWIAPGAVLRDHVNIGSGTLIGMGSVVIGDVPENEVWCGNPARKLRDK